jgi:hypothetical protein
VDDSQSLIGVNSLISNDQINTGAGHDISHNKDKRPSIEDDKSSSSDQSPNDSDSDNDDVGATPPRGKNAKSLLNLRQRILPIAKNRGGKTLKLAPQYKSSSESDSDNDDVWDSKNGKSLLNQPQRILPTVQNLGGKKSQSPTPTQIPLCIPDSSSSPLSKRLIYSESKYRGDHEFLLLLPPQSNSSIHIAF